MSSNEVDLASQVIDCMSNLPPTDVLSLNREAMDTESSDRAHFHSSSAPTELPPIYGQEVTEGWIEAHTQLTQEMSALREHLIRHPPPPATSESAPLTESMMGLATQIAALQRGVDDLRQLARRLSEITEAADQIHEMSERFATLSTGEEWEQPLKVLQEVSENIEAICK